MAKILIVDDNKDTVKLIATILKSAGFQVELAYSGEEALKKVKTKLPDLITLDIMMPGLSGWDVYERIRQRYDHRTKIIFLSALEVSPERKRQLIKEGVSDYIIKPFSNDNLIGKIKAALHT
ncbi:MAG TPA: response regulator transcription factor [Bacteroidia bacterium]|nr:response regulator transcription factor [Bacteroidia bacterium]